MSAKTAGIVNTPVAGQWAPYVQPYAQPRTTVWPTTYVNWPVKTDEERLRFALELIAESDLTHDAIKTIAERALRQGGKS